MRKKKTEEPGFDARNYEAPRVCRRCIHCRYILNIVHNEEELACMVYDNFPKCESTDKKKIGDAYLEMVKWQMEYIVDPEGTCDLFSPISSSSIALSPKNIVGIF